MHKIWVKPAELHRSNHLLEKDDFFSEVTSYQYQQRYREKFSNFNIVFPTRILKKVKIFDFFFDFFFGADFLFLKKNKKTLCSAVDIDMK